MLQALSASGPPDEHADEMMLFGQFVGAWDLEITLYDLDGHVHAEGPGEWFFDWVLEGRAIQDVLIRPPRAQRTGETPTDFWEYGTTVRVFDGSSGLWRVTWFAPRRGGALAFAARPGDRGEIVLDGAADDLTFQWIFSEITPETFLWRGSASDDDGRTWLLLQEMRARRRPGTQQRIAR